MVVDELCRRIGALLAEKDGYKISRGSIEGEKVILLEPLTFMNLSGNAVAEVLRNTQVEPENIIVIHDDIDLPTGALRIRTGGSSGGHRGVESVLQRLGSREFQRVRIGVGRDESRDVKDFVLSCFHPDEREAVNKAIDDACDAVQLMMRSGAEVAMNRYNRRATPKKN